MIRITTLAVLAALASPVYATNVLQQENGNAANTCTPALTQYDIGLQCLLKQGAVMTELPQTFRQK